MSASTQDFITGFDSTSSTTITGAQLTQQVNQATPYADKGLVVVTSDNSGAPNVPRADITTKWKNYIWLRIGASFVTPYVWNPNLSSPDSTYYNWVTIASASYGSQTIPGYALITNSVPSSAITSLDWSKVTGGPTAAVLNNYNTTYISNGYMNNTSLVFGDLAGGASGAGTQLQSPTIAVGVVTGQNLLAQSQTGVAGKLALGTITAANIANNTITAAQLVTNSGVATTAGGTGAVDPGLNILVPTTSIVGIPGAGSSTNASAPGDVLGISYNATTSKRGFVTIQRALLNLAEPTSQTYDQYLKVAAGGTTYSLATGIGATIGRILQRVVVTNTSSEAGNAGNNGTSYTNGKISTVIKITNFVPISASSTLVIRVSGIVMTNSSADNSRVNLFYDPSGTATFSGGYATAVVTWISTTWSGNSTGILFPDIIYKITSGQTTRMDFAFGFASSTFTPTMQANVGIEITEYL